MALKFKRPFGPGSTAKTRTIQKRQNAIGRDLRRGKAFRKLIRQGKKK